LALGSRIAARFAGEIGLDEDLGELRGQVRPAHFGE
jgi:hypothetical protein